MWGNFRSCLKCVKDPFEAQEGRWDFSRDDEREKSLISCSGKNLLVFSSSGRKFGVPLELRQGPQGPVRIASGNSSLHASCEGPLEIPLQAVQGPMSSSRVEAGTSGFLSRADMDLGLPMEFQHGCQALSLSESWKSALLSSFKISVRLPVELT